ncbi:MAG: histidine phosphatase family protein [Candidatus Nealsonbacteria bacterium]
MNNKYFLLRHGESLRNIKKVAACWPEKALSPLTKKGKEQIKKIGKKLKNIDLIFASDLQRTKQTAEIVGKILEVKPKFDKRLREHNVGILNGKKIKEVGKFWNKEGKLSPLEYFSKRFKIAPPGGETYADMEKRVYNFLKEVDKKYKGKNILIISHGRPLTLLEKAVYGYDLKQLVKIIKGKKEIKTGEVRKIK